jgi:DNA-binding NarL/FixJ family response regulator
MHQAQDGFAARHAHVAVALLSPRQREVAALITEDFSNGEIAARLVLSEGTVANHMEHILRRSGARNRVQLAVWVAEYQLCESCGARSRTGHS